MAKEELNKEKKEIPENVLLVGKKPIKAYFYGVAKIFGKHKEISVQARGKSLVTAINLTEILKKEKKAKVKRITIGTDEFEGKEGKKISVSTIEINLEKI